MEDAGQVHLQHGHPVVQRELDCFVAEDGAGVVHEDIDLPESFDRVIDQNFGRSGVRQVGGEGDRVAACAGDGVGCLLGGATIAVTGDGGASLCESDCDGCAQARCRAGNQCLFAVKLKFLQDALRCLGRHFAHDGKGSRDAWWAANKEHRAEG